VTRAARQLRGELDLLDPVLAERGELDREIEAPDEAGAEGGGG
jgi:hypothetical protein